MSISTLSTPQSTLTITESNLDSVVTSLSRQKVYPVFVDSPLVYTMLGIAGRNGAGLMIKHTSTICDFIFFDATIYLVRYDTSTGAFSRKYQLNMTLIS